jgi:abortive infection bacteriophage resistance protein
MNFSKPAISISNQIELLESRGLNFSDKPFAAHFLQHVSYYRLAGYWWPMQSDKVNHLFKEGSDFSNVVDLYNFDRELRLMALIWLNELRLE